jgi:hypothetical protein
MSTPYAIPRIRLVIPRKGLCHSGAAWKQAIRPPCGNAMPNFHRPVSTPGLWRGAPKSSPVWRRAEIGD